MDPIADKLLIAAALLSLVSLDRLDAWLAMVVVAREFAVSGLRVAAGQQGVVIPASGLGKVKTIVQSAAVLALIAAPDAGAWWVQALVYVMVLATVVSGADYFLNFRRRLEEMSRQAAATGRPTARGRAAGGGSAGLEHLGPRQAVHEQRPVHGAPVDVAHGEQQVAGARRHCRRGRW